MDLQHNKLNFRIPKAYESKSSAFLCPINTQYFHWVVLQLTNRPSEFPQVGSYRPAAKFNNRKKTLTSKSTKAFQVLIDKLLAQRNLFDINNKHFKKWCLQIFKPFFNIFELRTIQIQYILKDKTTTIINHYTDLKI